MPAREHVLEVRLSVNARDELAAWTDVALHREFASEGDCVDWLATQRDGVPPEIGEAQERLRTGGAPDAVVVRGMPIDAFRSIPTPQRYREPDEFVAEPADLLHGLIGSALGEAIGYRGQQSGRIFNDVIPVPELALRADHSGGFVRAFDLHTEDSFHPLAPTYFGLFCVRNDDAVPCTLGFLRGANIGTADLQQLRRARARIHANSGQRMGVGDDDRPRLPLIWGPDADPCFRLNLAHIEPTDFETAVDERAARALEGAIRETELDLVLEAGDSLWLDNRRVAHSRKAYQPRLDGTDRWLKRLAVVPDLAPLAPLLYSERVLDNDLLASRSSELPTSWESAGRSSG